MFRRFLLPTALLAFACLALPAAAAPAAPPPRPSNLRSDILYTHKGEFVQVSPMRALTLNAHVEQFAYDPLGLEIAVVGSETTGDQTTHFVKTIDARSGHEMSRLTVIAPEDDQSSGLMLLGWSISGKYLLLRRFTPDPQKPNDWVTEYLRWDLSANPQAAQVISPESELPQGAKREEEYDNGFASPDNRWIVFREDFHATDAEGKPEPRQSAYLLYDTERNLFRTLVLPPGASAYSWSDASHLKVNQNTIRQQFDVVTGQISPRPMSSGAAPLAASKQYPDLSLETEYRVQEDKQPTGGHLGSYLIWVRRTPFRAGPLGAVVAGLMPSSRDTETGPYDARDEPQAVWSPTGKQIAFISGGDVWVTDLATAAGTFPREKMAVGLKLSCAEEQMLAMTNLKQIGLGIIQYTQDSDENLPAADGWMKTISPYIKSTDVFGVDDHAVVYEPPADLALAKMESPADTEMAYMDLPCARVVLFCDGHVKVFAK